MWQLPVGTEQRVEICKLFFVRQLAEEQKIDSFFKTKTFLGSKASDQIINVNSTVVELAVDWYGDTVYSSEEMIVEISVRPVRTPLPSKSRNPRFT